jgi:hypothetical protein
VVWDVQYRRLSPAKYHLLSDAEASSLAFTSTWLLEVAVALATSEEIWVESGGPR